MQAKIHIKQRHLGRNASSIAHLWNISFLPELMSTRSILLAYEQSARKLLRRILDFIWERAASAATSALSFTTSALPFLRGAR
jgi:hypothetical protein